MRIPTAAEYIRDASFYSNQRYQWIRPIIDRVLQDQFEDSEIPGFVDSLYAGLGAQVVPPIAQSPPPLKTAAAPVINRIISIDSVTNIGLVDLSAPIQLYPGLNIFYGKNASGKSSLYVALCNLLGVQKRTCHNLNKTETALQAQVTAEETKIGPILLKWSGGPPLQAKGARIFDSEICSFLVDRDQENQFEIAHLKSEYFPLLQAAISGVEAALESCVQHLRKEFLTAQEILSQKVPNFPEIESTLTPEFLENNRFKDELYQVLATLEAAITLLLKEAPESTIKNLAAAQRAGREILENLGSFKINQTTEGPEAISWKFSLGEKLLLIQTTLQQHATLKGLTNQEGQAKLGGILKKEWTQSEKWRQFIEASLSFLSSLPKEDAKEYSTAKCPYCLQQLTSATAKELITAYQTLHSENKEQLSKCEERLNELQQYCGVALLALQKVPEKLQQLYTELPTLGLESRPTCDFKLLEALLSSTITSMQNKTPSSPEASLLTTIEAFGADLVECDKHFSQAMYALMQSEQARGENLKNLNEAVEPLKFKKALTENQKTILEYLSTRKKILSIQEHLTDLVALKRALSTCATQFSKDIPLGVFKTLLQNEYDALGYTPPEILNIRCATSGTKNRRVYSLRDKRLSEIFSEGERKIHALADFLAESTLNNFHGVYIFDDPVNSLDEDRIERVSDRIKRLVAKGNQVLIFTHNLVFLNSLVDTTEEKITEITRLDNQVLFTPEVILGDNRELSKRFREIQGRMTTLSKEIEKQRDIYGLRNIYDLMSGYLESYVEIRIFKNTINRYRPNIRMHSLNKLTTIDPATLMPIIELYQQTSRKGSRHSQPTGTPEPTYTELLGHYNQLTKNFPIK